jgi:NAD(P)-dependent dehydrogenase (short-subunit alcohol dehydrogenase family)
MNILDCFSLTGKKALIYSPQYIYGEEIAAGLCEAGAEVWFCGEDKDGMEALAARLHDAGHQIHGIITYHQGKESNAEELSHVVRIKMGTLDIYVDNGSNSLLKGWVHGFAAIYENLKRTQLGLMLTVKHLGLIMAAQGFGSMIFVSDYAALVGFDRQNYINTPEKFEQDFSLNYGFVKGSYVNYLRQAAGYLGEHNARCNCIAYAPLAENVPEGFSKAFIRHSHLKRLATARDIKAAVVFLASDASAYITGITLPVDGGYTAK